MTVHAAPAYPPLILASTSRYRRELLERLRLPFTTQAPQVDETPLPAETPREVALRLAISKARAISAKLSVGLVIGSDQVAHCEGVQLAKPESHARAVEQLRFMRGKTTYFDTALALINASSGKLQTEIVSTTVVIEPLTDQQIEAYLQAEKPYDCAGSAKSEALGISLMSSLSGDDPTALVGLPLIALTRMLRNEGVDPLLAEHLPA